MCSGSQPQFGNEVIRMVNGNMLSAGFWLASFKSAWDPVYPEQNRNVREILSNLIGYLEDWELEKTDNLRKMETPGMVYNPTYSIQPFSFWKTHAREFQGMFFLLFFFSFFFGFHHKLHKKKKSLSHKTASRHFVTI